MRMTHPRCENNDTVLQRCRCQCRRSRSRLRK